MSFNDLGIMRNFPNVFTLYIYIHVTYILYAIEKGNFSIKKKIEKEFHFLIIANTNG